jgi:hypothetical protein
MFVPLALLLAFLCSGCFVNKMLNQALDATFVGAGTQLILVTESLSRLPGMDTLVTSAHDSLLCRIEFRNSIVKMIKGENYLNVSTDSLNLVGPLLSILDDTGTLDSPRDSVASHRKVQWACVQKTKMTILGSNWNTDVDSCSATMEFHVKVSLKKPTDSVWTESLSECCRGYYHVFRDSTVVDSVVKIDCPTKK